MTRVAVALGSNLGDRAEHLDYAVARLRALLREVSVSRYHETVPVGAWGPQPLYLNAAVAGVTILAPHDLLDALLGIERERGRERPRRNAARTLDIDLILFGDQIVQEPDLMVPHPRFRERRFVLEPLAEIAPDMRDPVTGHSVRILMDMLDARQ